MDLIDEISKLLNFTYRFELVPDKNYGKYDPVKKEWDGIVRHVMDRVSILKFLYLINLPNPKFIF